MSTIEIKTNTLKAIDALKSSNLIDSSRILTDPIECFAYSFDNSRQYFQPDAVIFAMSTEEIQALIKICQEFKVPITARGRGTGTTGASIPEAGGIVLSLERMNQILKFDPANRVMVVQAGVLNQQVQDLAKTAGFFWCPDPSSQAYCSVGGNLATCAGGPRAVKYGVTRDHVLGLTAILGTGDIITTGCYTTKGVVGYDLTRLLVGSEGTLGIITEATLKLTPLPEKISGLTAHYKTLKGCAEAITQIMSQPAIPSALEFLDAESLRLIRSREPNLIPEETNAMLMIEIDGFENQIEMLQNKILTACKHDDLIQASAVQNTAELWKARKALSPLLRDIAPKKINEDIVVPVSTLPEFLLKVNDLTSKMGIHNVNFGHAGNGNIHVNLLINPDDKNQYENAISCLDQIFDLVLNLNGTLSGEHGVGREKRPYVDREINQTTIKVMKQVKQLFDPYGILNPMKIFK